MNQGQKSSKKGYEGFLLTLEILHSLFLYQILVILYQIGILSGKQCEIGKTAIII